MTDTGRQRLADFGRALDRLDEALAVPPDAPLAVDGTIQRFEFTFELAWKTAKAALVAESIPTRSPREALRESMRMGWLADERAWLEMIDDRNMASHIYREEVADQIYAHVRVNVNALRALYTLLVARYA